MKTGEGKTLVATLPVTLNALTGEGVHVVTVNDYLAKRDTQWMGPIYNALGISVASIQHEAAFLFDPAYESEDVRLRHLRPITRRQAYEADVTYGTNNEFGFDYLRDNMVGDLSQCVQRDLNYAIVDEVDNILIDEARTPLIISGAAEEATSAYVKAERAVQNFKGISDTKVDEMGKELGKEAALARVNSEYDYRFDEKERNLFLTPRGEYKIAAYFSDPDMYGRVGQQEEDLTRIDERLKNDHHVKSALRAKQFYLRDRDYVVKDGEVIIVDEFTGRLMFGRRYSEGLHQAIEAKEGVKIQRESITMATITFQNYFRMYDKLAGMTGTAVTEAEEFDKIYKLDVVVIPTNKPLIRDEYKDQIYKNEEAKFRAVGREIEELNKEGRPVLVGTVSIEKSEHLSQMLQKKGIPHQVLNAKPERAEKEADIVRQAGKKGMVTIATNMAGRGVDIILGGNPEGRDPQEWQAEHDKVVQLGGLHIVGTERHEARRIDNQLRGRAGRQGDPGSSRFYVSLEDDIMRRFGGDRVKGFMEWAGFDEDTPLEHGMVSKVIENAQQKVEAYHFDIRKHLVDYDDVVNKQREVIYDERRKILSGADLKANIQDMIKDALRDIVHNHLGDERADQWDLDGLVAGANAILPLPPYLSKDAISKMSRKEVEQKLEEYAESLYEEREKELGPQNMRVVERLVMLRAFDSHWVEHLTAMENMRESIGLQSLAQRDPLVAYKTQGHETFQNMMAGVQHDIVHMIYHVGIVKQEKPRERERVPAGNRIGRNDPCPCGSGKKYKKCCGKEGKS
jgi:preprotein translocase subunit SecA